MGIEIWLGVAAVAGPLLALLYTYLSSKWSWLKDLKDKSQIDEIVEAAVVEVYQNSVRGLKEASADGKLTADEKKQVMDEAVDAAKRIAKEQGLPLLQELALPVIKSLIEKAVTKLSK